MSWLHGCAVQAANLLLLLLLLATSVASNDDEGVTREAGGPAPATSAHDAGAAGGSGDGSLEQEAAIMRLLRDAAPNSDPFLNPLGHGWDPGDTATPHCSWQGVECDRAGHVTIIVSYTEEYEDLGTPKGWPDVPKPSSPLIPELAQLTRLREVSFSLLRERAVPRLPPEWWLRGSFPRLQQLSLFVPALSAGPLPDIQPGAMPQLVALEMHLGRISASLPPSWGSDPAILPSLTVLDVRLAITGSLPVEWAAGFRQLISLQLTNMTREVPGCGPPKDSLPSQKGATAAEEVQGAPAGALPPRWATGFPKLESLRLEGFVSRGPIPAAWTRPGSFPALAALALYACQLSGTLPAALVDGRPGLNTLTLRHNCLNGRLPESWSGSKLELLALTDNALTGPAFPPAWLSSDALLKLEHFDIELNPALTGTLPANLPWRNLQTLWLAGTSLEGRIPDAWCDAPFAANLSHLSIDNTRVEPVMPGCAARSMPKVSSSMLTAVQRARLGGAAARVQSGTTFSAALATVLASVAVCTAAGLLLWRRGKCGSWLQPGERQPLLLSQRRGGASLPAPAFATAPGAAAVHPVRRARLMSVLASAAAEGSGRGIEMMPVRALSTVLAHQLSASSGRAVVTGAAGPPPEPANGEEESLRLLPPGREHLRGAGQSAVGREWGLETTSLLLEAEELELVVGADGQLVELGEGAFAIVYLGKLGGVPVAVKVFELDPGIQSGSIWREVAMLRDCTHEHVVPLYGVSIKGQVVLLAMELMQGGTLRSALLHPSRREALTWRARGRQAAIEVASALQYLHSRSIMHGDLSSSACGECLVHGTAVCDAGTGVRPSAFQLKRNEEQRCLQGPPRVQALRGSNVLLDERLTAYVGDMGVARIVAETSLSAGAFCLTHAAPEQVLGLRCTLATDVYSLGILLIELTTQVAVLKRGNWRLPTVPEECSQAVLALIEDCVASEPDLRPTASQVLQRLQADHVMAPKTRRAATVATAEPAPPKRSRKSGKAVAPDGGASAATALAATKADEIESREQQQQQQQQPGQLSYYLMKSEPDVFGIDDLQQRPGQTEPWDGVRSHQAKKVMQGMRVGDKAFFYHSNAKPPGIVGVIEANKVRRLRGNALPPFLPAEQVVREAYPDHTQFEQGGKFYDASSKPDSPKWFMVDVKFERQLARQIPLEELKRHGAAGGPLAAMALIKYGRLSVQPVTAADTMAPPKPSSEKERGDTATAVVAYALGAVTVGALMLAKALRKKLKRRRRVLGVLPARYQSSRFPGKPLMPILGKAMILRTYEQACKATTLDAVVVATDDERIAEVCRAAGAQVVMTNPDCPNGTERCEEAVSKLGKHYDLVVNIQGDEPLIEPECIDAVVRALQESPDAVYSTACTPLAHAEVPLRQRVKCVTDVNGYAIYFSRGVLPYNKDGEIREYPTPWHDRPYLLHLGLQCYDRSFLRQYCKMPATPLQMMEDLEQLKILENGYRMKVVVVDHSAHGVDLPEDVESIEAVMRQHGLQ
ncbi:3-deoxy-manno-octulosonate cytidylyltransferase [Chlorella vulgaris]